MIHRAILTTAFAILVATFATADDYFLTIGGGYGPDGNQVSLERNVQFQTRVLAAERTDNPPHEVYFADGDDPDSDLQCRDQALAKQRSRAVRMMTEVLGEADELGLYYRTSEVPQLKGPTTKEGLQRKFRELSRKLGAGDRLIVYVTCHGSKAESESSSDYDYEFDDQTQKWVARGEGSDEAAKNPADKYNTSIRLWDDEPLTGRQLGRWLDRFSPKVTVVVVMVQCYAGGFSHLIFQQHDADLGLAAGRRCGFFAQVHNRGAAGCTPEIDEANYKEYSTYFWAALGGKTRGGKEIERPDYNEDGKTSFAEAHAYTVIESDTVDIPVRTSDAFLRHYSRHDKSPKDDDDEDASAVSQMFKLFSSGDDEKASKLKKLQGSLADLALLAPPEQAAILKQLPAKCGLKESSTVEAVKVKLRTATNKLKIAKSKHATAASACSDAEEDLYDDVIQKWPELTSSYAPLMAALTSDRAAEFADFVGELASYQTWQAAYKRQEELTDKVLDLERAEAKLQRLRATAETIVLAHNLPHIAPAEIVERYQELISLEEQGL